MGRTIPRHILSRPAFLLLFAVAVSFSAPALAAELSGENLLQVGTIILTAFLLPMIWTFRRETQTEMAAMNEKMIALAISVARIEERDRIVELLDKRLPNG